MLRNVLKLHLKPVIQTEFKIYTGFESDSPIHTGRGSLPLGLDRSSHSVQNRVLKPFYPLRLQGTLKLLQDLACLTNLELSNICLIGDRFDMYEKKEKKTQAEACPRPLRQGC